MTEMDELDRSEVRARLAHVRRLAAQDALHHLTMTPLTEGQTPPPANRVIDAFGRGPGSPFHQPDFRPPWAPDWTPRPLNDPSDDDGIEWRFA